MAKTDTLDLFGRDYLPPGLRYQENFLSPSEEQDLLRSFAHLPFREFEFHGFTAKRRTVSFGWRFGFSEGRLAKTEGMPEFLHVFRERAERFGDLASGALQHVLITEYGPGAAIGWHKDRSVFGDVLGISLLSPCSFRMRLRMGDRCSDRR